MDPEIKALLEAQARAQARFVREAEIRKKQQRIAKEAAVKSASAKPEAQVRKHAHHRSSRNKKDPILPISSTAARNQPWPLRI